MRFGTYHVFQCPPGQEPARVVAEELARAELAEALGFDDIWVPEQHFSPYCLAGDALLLAGHLAARTRRVCIGTAVVNLTFTHPLRFAEQVEEFARYRAALAAAGVDAAPVLARATVLKYAFLAPTRAEARTLAREALEWDLAILQHLTTPTTTEMPRGYELYERRGGRLPEYAYDGWLEHVLLFDDPDGCAEKIARLRDAGIERLLLWMGPGGVRHDLLVRSMRLFAEAVMPHFR